MSFRWSPLLILAWAGIALANPLDKSDLNSDGASDTQDIEIFASRYLGQDSTTVDWCAFYVSSVTNPKYFRQITSDKAEHYKSLLNLIATTNECGVVTWKGDKSDLDGDGDVDLDDLTIFSTNYLQLHWSAVDWCVFHGSVLAGAEFEGRPTRYYLKHFAELLSFINIHFACGGGEPPGNALAVESSPRFLTRIAAAADGQLYVSDPRVGSVFIYDEFMVLKGELKGLDKPLGIAVDSFGRILVGNDGRDNIEVYDPTNGALLAVFGEGLVEMPTAITLDDSGKIYVTDSRKDRVQVFDTAYNLVRSIGSAGLANDTLTFPMDVEIINQDVFVADQGGDRVQVFDLNGNWLRSFTFEGVAGQNCNWFTGVCEIPGIPPFTRIQALSKDSLGRLHVLDNFAASVMIFDPADGAYVAAYGGYGTDSGQLRVPMDVKLLTSDTAIVTPGDGDRVEIFGTP